MKTFITSITLSAVLSSVLFAAPANQADLVQLRQEMQELKQLVTELKKSNDALRARSTSYSEGEAVDTKSHEFQALKEDVMQMQTELESNAKSGFQLAGYASFDWTDQQGSDNEFSGVKFAPIFHYQYGDIFQFEGELEFTTNNQGETDTELEYAAGTLFLNDYMGLQLGKFMSPLGQFVQNQHPSWINKLPATPVGFGHDGAAPTSFVGAALRGGLPKVVDIRSNYVVFVGNAPTFGEAPDGDVVVDASGKTSSGDASKTWGGRFALNPVGGMEIGVSYAKGKVSETLTATTIVGGSAIDDKLQRDYDVAGVDFMYNVNAIDIKAEYIEQKIGDNDKSTLEGGTWRAWYAQASYQFAFLPIEPVLRYSDYHNPEIERNQWAIGLNYLFANNLIAKIAYEYNDNEDNAGDPSVNNNRVLTQLAFGF